jgi:predicted enzyme related to lactoylglutathione lyase
MPEYAPGTPSWVDLGSPDVDASVAFYTGLFGWSASDPGPPETGGYRLFREGDKEVAGLGPLMMEGQPPAWLNYVSVANADETAAKAAEAGGTVHVAPMDVMDLGRMSVIADPTGAAFGIWQPGTHKGAALVNEPASLVWNELNTRDIEAPKPFYEAVFGWDADTAPMGDVEYTTWQLGEKQIAGMIAMSEQVPDTVPAHWLAYFAVADTDATIEKAKELGGSLVFGPMDIPVGRFAVLSDAHGAIFGVMAS